VHPELLPQAAGVRVERARRAEGAEAPDVAEQLRLREDPRGLRGQRAQQRELLGRERHPHAAQAHLPAQRVEHQLPHPQQPRAAAGRGPPQDGGDPQPQLAVGERLGHEVVRPAFQRAHAVAPPGAAGEHDQRQPRIEPRPRRARLADPANQLEPRVVGQPDVDDGQVDPVVLERAHGLAHTPRGEQRVAVRREVVGEERAGRGIVLDDQDGDGIGHAHSRAAAPDSRPPAIAGSPDEERSPPPNTPPA
jgi:hypothetical protein